MSRTSRFSASPSASASAALSRACRAPGLELQSNGEKLQIAANGKFLVPASLPDGTPYDLTVSKQPANQVCTVSNGRGVLEKIGCCGRNRHLPVSDPVLYGLARSVYTRIARLALEEKGVRYTLEEVEIFGPAGVPAEQLARQPFGRIPAFAHDGFVLYETARSRATSTKRSPARACSRRSCAPGRA